MAATTAKLIESFPRAAEEERKLTNSITSKFFILRRCDAVFFILHWIGVQRSALNEVFAKKLLDHLI
jgi:hypothetical protein